MVLKALPKATSGIKIFLFCSEANSSFFFFFLQTIYNIIKNKTKHCDMPTCQFI